MGANHRTVLGFDPGTARTGFGLIRREGTKVHLVRCGLIETDKTDAAEQRLVTLRNQIKELLATERPDEVAVEKLFFATNAKTAMAVAEARGVILLTIADAGYRIAEYTPLQVKQSVTGHGQADKRQVATMVCRQLGLATAPKPDDVTDALAIALCHAFWRTT